MPKISIIIPAYNVEDYIEKCLLSVFNQNYKDYEVIVINDGSTDNTLNIIKKFKNIKLINQKNKGLSMARNTGVKNSLGEYIFFLDSDDYISPHFLEDISKKINDEDIIRFQINVLDDEKITPYPEEEFINLNGTKAFSKIVKYHFVENAWAYLFKRDYYLKGRYEFQNGYHEDYGLIPLVIIKANKVSSYNIVGYNYYQRNNSIMNNNNYNKTLIKVEDFYNHYKYLINKDDNQIYKSYLANSLIKKICSLKYRDYLKYKKIMFQEKVYQNILGDTFLRKIKKIILYISPKIFFKIK